MGDEPIIGGSPTKNGTHGKFIKVKEGLKILVRIKTNLLNGFIWNIHKETSLD